MEDRAQNIVVKNPATGERIVELGAAPRGEVRAAVQRARAAQAEWGRLGFSERRQALRRYRDLLIDQSDRIVSVLVRESGETRAEAFGNELFYVCDAIGYWTGQGARFIAPQKIRPHRLNFKTKKVVSWYEPIGVIGIISPWNFPLVLTLGEAVPALMAGNAVVIKPSELTPTSVLEAAALAREVSGLPEHLIQVVVGFAETAEALIDEVDMVSFTGSVETGRKVARRAAERLIPVSLELGGKDAMIVLRDADLERAANACVWGALMNSGQVCTSIERVYVEEPVYEEFTSRVAAKVDGLRQGNGLEEADIGSMTSPAQVEKVKLQITDALAHGARVLRGGQPPDGDGLFYPPTILVDVNHEMAVMTEETFGPVIPIMRVANWEEALRLANDSPYGLDGSVFTRDPRLIRTLTRGLHTGSVCVNECLVNFVILDAPMGGRKQSGFGRRHGADGIRKYCHQKTVVTDRFGMKDEFNCMGLVSVRRKAVLFPDLRLPDLQPGGLAVVSQSGGLVGSLTRTMLSRGLGLTHYVSSGNEAVSELSQYVHYFAHDPDVRVILAIVEGVKDPELLARAVQEAAAAGKPVVILKVGRSPKGMAAALAHTGSLAGDDRIFEAFCKSYGLVRVGDVSEMLNTAEFFQRTSCLPSGSRAAYITFSGGLRALVADLAADAGLELPELSRESERRLAQVLGVGSSVGNPLDAGWAGLSSQETFLLCVNTLLDDPNVDAVVVQEDLPQNDVRPDKESNLMAVADIAKTSAKPIAVFSCVSPGANAYGLAFKAKCGLPFLDEARDSVLAVKHLADFAQTVRKRGTSTREEGDSKPTLSAEQIEWLQRKRSLNEWESYALLRRFEVPVAEAARAGTAEEAADIADRMGYPIVVKALVQGITHKTEAGLVELGLARRSDVLAACRRMAARLDGAHAGAFEGFLVQEMVRDGIETIIGAVDDPQLGPAVMFGIGGEFVEIYRDVVFRMVPCSEESAREMIRSIKARALLEGFRGRAVVDERALASAIVAVSDMMLAGGGLIGSIDINPFLCLPRGGKALDALVVPKAATHVIREP